MPRLVKTREMAEKLTSEGSVASFKYQCESINGFTLILPLIQLRYPFLIMYIETPLWFQLSSFHYFKKLFNVLSTAVVCSACNQCPASAIF